MNTKNRGWLVWRNISLGVGLFTCFGYIIFDIVYMKLAGIADFAWLYAMVLATPMMVIWWLCLIAAVVSAVIFTVVSIRRGLNNVGNYILVAEGIILVFSPFAISNIIVNLQSKIRMGDSFYHVVSGGVDCYGEKEDDTIAGFTPYYESRNSSGEVEMERECLEVDLRE